jgi:hypothetical protein
MRVIDGILGVDRHRAETGGAPHSRGVRTPQCVDREGVNPRLARFSLKY